MATIVAAAGGGNWTSTTTWVGGVVPTLSDDVQLDATSGNVTINAAAVGRSLDCNGYTGTLTHAASVMLTLGTSTPGPGNRILRFVSGMTYTLGDNTSSNISFNANSATQQTIDFATQTIGPVGFGGAGGNYLLVSPMIANNLTSAAPGITLSAGILDTNGQTVSFGSITSAGATVRTLTLGSSTVNLVRSNTTSINFTGTTNNLTLNADTSTINITTTANVTIVGAGKTFNNVVISSGAALTLNGANTYNNLSVTPGSLTGAAMNLTANQTVTGTFTVGGSDVLTRYLVYSSVDGTQRTISAGSVSAQWVDFADIIATGTANWDLSAIPGGSGDSGGNSGIMFTNPTTQTWNGTAGGNWSANAWSGRVPLPQDTAIINASFNPSQTLTLNLRRFCGNLDFTGVSNNPTFAVGTLTRAFYGSITLSPNMSLSGNAGSLVMKGRATHTITTAGKNLPIGLTIDGFGGTYTLQDDYTSTVGPVILSQGTLDTNNKHVIGYTFTSSSGFSRALNLGTSLWELGASASTVWNISNSTGLTVNASNATISLYTVSASARVFVGAGYTYGTLNYTLAGSSGSLTVTGSNTFGNINFTDTTTARSLLFTAGTTTTVTGMFNVNGTSGVPMTIDSATAASHTLSKPSGTVSCDYLSIAHSAATGGASWYAGANSTNGGNNTGWIFAAAPTSNPGFFEFL